MKKVIAYILIAVCFCMPLLACSEKKEEISRSPIPIDDARRDSLIAVANQTVVADVETTWNGRVENVSYEIEEIPSTAKKGSEIWKIFAESATDEEKENGELDYYEGKNYLVTATVKFVRSQSSFTATYKVRITYENGKAILHNFGVSSVFPF